MRRTKNPRKRHPKTAGPRRGRTTLRDWEPACTVEITVGSSVQDERCRTVKRVLARRFFREVEGLAEETFGGGSVVRAGGQWGCKTVDGREVPIRETSAVVTATVPAKGCAGLARKAEGFARRLARRYLQDAVHVSVRDAAGDTCRAEVGQEEKQEPVQQACRTLVR